MPRRGRAGKDTFGICQVCPLLNAMRACKAAGHARSSLESELSKLGKGCLKGLPHYLGGGSDPCPYLKGQNTLVKKHPQTVKDSAALL